MRNQIDNILTVDVEDYFQVENFKKTVKFSDWEKYECRVVKNTDKILDILKRAGIKATFFILGWTAERYPELVKKIHKDGHEVASHGYAHRLIYGQTQEEFREDLKKSKKILEGIIGETVMGYRAPSFSITRKSMWALDILKEEGFGYDSSLFPIRYGHGGLPEAGRYPHKIGNLWELPLSTVRVLGQNIPAAGGGYFRIYPYCLTKWAIRKINIEGQPAVVYIHPWELDPGQPVIEAGRIGVFRHYVNLSKTEKKLKKLLRDFKFAPIREYLKSIT